MTPLSRRNLLVLAASSAVLAGCAPVSPPATPSLKPSGVPAATTPTAEDWAAFGTSLVGVLALPDSKTYDEVRLTENPRWDSARPLGILSAASPTDVALALAFAVKHALPLALRSGGHSYPGYSAGGAPATGLPPALVIDSRALNNVVVHADSSVTIGAGASLAQVYNRLGTHDLALAGGSCPTVGITGLTLGGGIGVLSRAFGLTCDALTEVQIVTADGTVRTANSKRDADLFWACRGGGGGHLGVVTALTFTTRPAPVVTVFSLSWPFSEAAKVVDAFQHWIAAADRQAWATLKLLAGSAHPAGPAVTLSGTWIGPAVELKAQLQPLFTAVGKPKSFTNATHTYATAMADFAGCGGIPVAECTTGPGGKLTREAFAATSHLAFAPLTAAAISTLLNQVVYAGSIPGAVEAGVSLDALGGAVADVAAADTAFAHRTAIMSLQYTATFATGTDPLPFDNYVRGFRNALVPQLGAAAYVNYADASLANPSQSYFASNAARLASIQAAYDPNHVFSQPQAY